jgi:DNA-directed RNA polymerase subunit RPC12/RpoP
MMVLRGCFKCQGDVYVEQSMDGAELVCLQCGSRRLIEARKLPRNRAVAARDLDLQRAAR